MARNSFSADFEGIDEFLSEVDQAENRLQARTIQELNQFKTVPERGAKLLTPVDENDLTKSITASNVHMSGLDEYWFSIGTTLHYALRMHEWTGNWGEDTKVKQARQWRGFTPGRKYLENAGLGSEDQFEQVGKKIADGLFKD